MKRYPMRHARLLLATTVVALVGCRPVQEQSALSQLPNGGAVASATANAAPSGNPDVTVRRVWASGYHYFYASSISPDGRYLSMIDGSTGDLAVRDLRSGKVHRLTERRQVKGTTPYQEPGVSVFSRDGRKIVVGWRDGSESELRVLDFSGDDSGTPLPSEPRVVFHKPEYRPTYPYDWSPDNREIVAKVYVAGANQLALISTVDGTYHALKSFDWREPSMAQFSPDGRYVAYDVPPAVDSRDLEVFVLSIDGKQETRIVDGRLLGWAPDGSILVGRNRGGTPAVWRVPVSNGRASGDPALVKADTWSIEPLGFAGSRFFYGVTVNPRQLHVANADLASGRLTSSPVAADVVPQGWDWSPDGKFLAYDGTTPGATGSVIGICGADGKDCRRINLDLNWTRRMQWDPDGRSLVLFTADAKSRHGFYRVDPASGTYRTILVTDGTEYATKRGHFALSPEGRTLYFTRSDPDSLVGRRELIAFDLESRTARHVTDVSSRDIWSPVALSPDGARLAVVYPGASAEEGVVGTIPVTGGAFTPLDTIPAGVHVRWINGWTADNQWVYWTTIRPQTDDYRYHLRLAPANGGEARELQLPDGLEGLVRIHPDGRRVAFEAGVPRGEVWVMEGLGRSAALSSTGGQP